MGLAKINLSSVMVTALYDLFAVYTLTVDVKQTLKVQVRRRTM